MYILVCNVLVKQNRQIIHRNDVEYKYLKKNKLIIIQQFYCKKNFLTKYNTYKYIMNIIYIHPL